MKTVAVIVAAMLCLSAMPTPTLGVGEEIILNFLEEFRARMCHPIPKWNLPALDPFEVAHAEVAVDNDYLVDFTGSITNFRLTGLSDFIINELQISTRPAKPCVLNVTLPLTAFKSLYTAYGSLAYIFRFAGDGDAEAYVKQLSLAVSFSINTLPKLGISNLKINFSIEEIFVYFQTLIEEPRINDFVHALINELGLELLHDVWELKQSDVQNIIEKKINDILGQYTLAEIGGIIGGGGSGGEGTDEPVFGPNDPPGDCKKTPLREMHPLLRLKQQQQLN